MTAKKISELAAAGALAGTEVLPIVQSGSTVKASAQAIADLASPDAAVVTFAPAVLANWTGSADPGNVDDALDQLASRLAGLGSASTAALDTDTTMAANSDTRVPSQKAIKAYADGLIAAADAMIFKGVIDCSANPNYPAADRGHTYRVSVAGKIGGASGTNVEVSDLLLCLTDSTASGDQATVGTSWAIAQANLDGAVIGPASASDGALARFNGTSGKLLKASPATIATADIDAAAVTYAKMQNVSATSRVLGRKTAGAGGVEEVTLSELLDFIGSAAQGDILYRGASSWTRLGAGASGQFLKTLGAGADPLWDTVSGVSGGLEFVTEVSVTGSAATTLSVSGLNLAADKAYLLTYVFKNAGSSALGIRQFYNSDTMSTNYSRGIITVGAWANQNNAVIVENAGNSQVVGLGLLIPDVSGRARAVSISTHGSTTGTNVQLASVVWDASTANVTEVTWSSTISNTLDIGSKVRIYKLT